MIDAKIKLLRESADMTQAHLARRLGISRSSVNAWEMGISIPSTQYLVELALIFDVSTDYLLGMQQKASVDVTGLGDDDVNLVVQLVRHLREKNGETT